MKKLLLLLAILPIVMSCNGQEKRDRKFFDIENLSENTTAKDYKEQLLTSKIKLQTKAENNATEYELNDRETEGGKKFQWEQYNFSSGNKAQSVAYLHEMKLKQLQFIIYKGKLVGATGSSMYSDASEIQKTVDYLTKKYGNPVDVMESYDKKSNVDGEDFQLYWENADKIIGIAYAHNQGDYITAEDLENNKATMFKVYEVFIFNKKLLEKLKKEDIEIEDFFGGMTTSMDIEKLGGMLHHIKMKDYKPSF